MASKEVAAHLLVRTGLAGVVDLLRPGWRRDLRVLAYHRVLPREPEETFSHDLELVSAWADDFDWQLGHLARHHDVITCAELARRLDQGRALSGREVIITFDDGYHDNESVALPLLARHGLPAVVFVATGYIGRPQTFWYDALVRDMLRTQVPALDLGELGGTLPLGQGPARRREAAALLLALLKKQPDTRRVALVQAWQAQMALPPADTTDAVHGPMSWDQVRNLVRGGVEIGSHTVTHPVLSQVQDPAQLRHELQASKREIERETGQTVVSMAYPVGGRHAYNDEVIAEVREAGYRFAFTYETGTNRPGAWDPMRLERLRVERYVSRQRFQAALAWPGMFG